MTDFQNLGQQFCTFYYQTFDQKRAELCSLFREHSMMTFEDTQLQGHVAIGEKLTSLPFEKVQHKIITLDAQPSSPTLGGVLVMVTGELLIDDETKPQKFSQVFHLMPEGGTFYVFNDIFRLNVG